jgi:hypothetical protein
MRSYFRWPAVCAAVALLGVASYGQGTPRIEFETNSVDFGHLAAVESVSGVFKFKNSGDGILKLEPPKPSCGCTDAKAIPDTLQPGQSGQITFQINLDHPMVLNVKTIAILSNDPKSPEVKLTAQLDYDQVYTIDTKSVRVTVPAAKQEAQESFVVSRGDGLPLGIDRITSSHEWITAAVDPAAKPDDSSTHVIVTLKRSPQAPPRFTGNIKLWNSKYPKTPVRTLTVVAEIEGELAANPRGLYWIFADQGNDTKAYAAGLLERKVQLKSVLGHDVEIKGAKCSIKGTSVQVVPTEPGKAFDLVLKLNEVPHSFTTGKITVDTSLSSLPQLEVPVTISVFKP